MVVTGNPMQARFRKSDRLRQQSEFDRAYASPWYAADRTLVIQAVANDDERTRLGLAVSRRVGNAVVRNRWKRLIREAFRTHRQQLPTGWDLVARPRRGAQADARAIADSLVALARRIDKQARRSKNRSRESF